MQTSFQHPVRLLRHVECFGGKTCRVCNAERLLLTGEMVAGKTEAVPFFNQGKCVFVINIYIFYLSGSKRMKTQGWSYWRCVNCRSSMWVCHLAHIWVICNPKGFLGREYNGWFRVRPVPWPFSPAPEVLRFVQRTAARLRFVFLCLLIGLACLRKARVLIVSHRTWHAISWEDGLLRER